MTTPSFILGNTAFGIDASKSVCHPRSVDAQVILSLSIQAAPVALANVVAYEKHGSARGFKLPRFFGDFAVTLSSSHAGMLETRIDHNSIAQHEGALDFDEFHELTGHLLLRFHSDGLLAATGIADVMGVPTPFDIRWQTSSPDSHV